MQKWLIACITIMLCVPFRMSAQESTYAAKVNRYIQQYSKLAVAEQKRSGVPAAVTLGQGILETEAGCSELVTGANNHFGIKCKSGWTGETFSHTDDAPDECFRKYKCCEDSYKDHSDYLKGTPRYAALFRLSVTDYAGWAYGLKRCGYATNPHYAPQLIKIIEDFHLQAYTYAAIGNSEEMPIANGSDNEKSDPSVTTPPANTALAAAPATNASVAPATTVTPLFSKKKQTNESVNSYQGAPAKGQILKVNGLRGFYAIKGEMLLQYALKFNVRYEHLLEINDLKDAPLPASMFVYLEKKNTKGVRSVHVVKSGENLLMISQAEGIQLRRLMTLNKLTIFGEEPVPGTKLHLQEPADKKPEVAFVNPPKEPLPTPRQAAYVQTSDKVPDATNNKVKTNHIVVNNDVPLNTMAAIPPAAAPAVTTATPIADKQEDYVTKPATEEQTVAATATDAPQPAVTETVEKSQEPVTTADNNPNTDIAVTTPTVSAPIEATAATPKPSELGTKPLLPDDAQAVTATGTVAQQQAKSLPAKEEAPAEPATAEPTVAAVTEAPQPEQKQETVNTPIISDGPAVANTPVAPEATTPVAPVSVLDATIASQPVVNTPAVSDAPAVAETSAASQPTTELAKTPQPVHIDAVDNATPKPADAPISTTSAPVVKTPAVAEVKQPTTPVNEEPQDEFSRLKARLDKVVYAKNDNTTATTATPAAPVVAKAAPVAEVPAPKEKAIDEVAKEAPRVSAAEAEKYYTVKKGDTAFNIARRNNITMRQLLNWNNLDFETVKVGQRLRVKE